MTVHLVGAGPGDPELLTMRAVRLLERADVVVHDRLAGPVLALAAGARLIDVGKHRGDSAHQAQINDLLVELGRSGAEVVRLKGGDPFVFGRGGEEAIALTDAGVPWTVVPGISTAIAAAGAADIPVTHRGVTDSFTVVTGHRRVGQTTNWEALARTGGTIVVLMGVSSRDEIVAGLVAGGIGSRHSCGRDRAGHDAHPTGGAHSPRRASGSERRGAGHDGDRHRRRAGPATPLEHLGAPRPMARRTGGADRRCRPAGARG